MELTILVGSDPAVSTVTQPMRFPGFIRSNVVDGVETRRAEQPLLYCNPNNTYTLEQTKTIIKSLYDSRGLTYPESISDECFRYLKGKWEELTKDDTQLETVLTDATIYTYFRKPRKPKAAKIVDETVNESYNEPETTPEPLDIKDPIVLKILSKAIARNWMFNRQQDIKNQKADDLLMLDMTARTRKNKTLANLGMVAVIQHFCIKQIENITDSLPNIVTISLEDEPIKRFLDRFIKNQGYYSKVLGIKIKPGWSRAKKLKTLLKLVGIKLATPKDLIGTQRVRIELPHDLMGILIAHYNSLQHRLDKLEHDGKSPRNNLGDKYDTTPLKALLDKVSKLEKGDKELLIKELILFFYGCSTKGEAGTHATTETSNRDTGKSPPVGVG